ncbi:bifunctional metallophosphatase/5'-nucleotidase [bacterium]|nr:bifunctional metallophosphatase/5'-nucleotidase [bacterium]
MRKRTSLLYTLFLLFNTVVFLLFSGCKKEDEENITIDVAIMTTADLQSSIVPFSSGKKESDITVGGYERIAAEAQKIRGEADISLLLSSGDDMIQPMSAIFHGEPEMLGMSMAGYDVVAPGNHEFDTGADVYKYALSFADFDVVCANISFTDAELDSIIVPYVIKDFDELRIGIFGLITPDFDRVCNPPGGGIFVDADYISCAQNAVAQLQSEDCDIIIALTHIGKTLDENLAAEVGDIDIIVGGHSHEYVYETIGNTIIVQDGAKGEYLGVLRFSYNNEQIENPQWETILLDSTVGYDAAIHDTMSKYIDVYNDSLGQVIGESSVDLDARESVVRQQESNLGNLVADSWLDWFDDADIAAVSGGSIRGDRIYPAGPLSYLTISEILPFRNEVVIARMTGSQIKQMFEISASALRIDGDGCADSCRCATGGFLQIGGARITIDTTQSPFCAVYSGNEVSEIINYGSRIVNVEIYHDGGWQPLDTAATYSVLLNSWTSSGGDGYYLFAMDDIPIENTTMITTDILASYIETHSPVSPSVEGRISFCSR